MSSCFIILNARAGPPTNIVIQPASQIGAFFGSAMFSVTADSLLPLNYQWSFNGAAIANATNSALILGPLGYAASGSYSVLVGNSTGTNRSSSALLTVSEAIVSTVGYGSTSFQNFLLQFTNLMAVSANSGTVYGFESNGTVEILPGYASQDAPPNLTNATAISLGIYANNLALQSDGKVIAWNYNSASATNVPSGVSNVTAIAAGYVSIGVTYDMALRSDGTVVGWYNTNVPLQVILSNAVAIASGEPNLFLALEADGTVFESANQATPPEMKLVPGLSNIIAISDGTLALKADGTVVGWDGLPSNPLPNVSNVVALAVANAEYLMALTSDGTVVGGATLLSQFPVALTNVFYIDINPIGGQGLALFNNGSPMLTVQPGNQFPTNGGTVWLHARAVGAQPMSYQWEFNGTDILDATNADLTITNAQASDSGLYSAFVSNLVGSATSRIASVTIKTSYTPVLMGVAKLLPNGSFLFNILTTNGSSLPLTNATGLAFEASSNLLDWIPLTNALTLTNGSAQLTDPNATNSTARFYRLVRP
jgi:Immunoglobulin domain